jgi:hypothetical protein
VLRLVSAGADTRRHAERLVLDGWRYQHNDFRKRDLDGNIATGRTDREAGKARQKPEHSIPWSVGDAHERYAQYEGLELDPRFDMFTGDEHDRYVCEMVSHLYDRLLKKELAKFADEAAYARAFSGHVIGKVVWDDEVGVRTRVRMKGGKPSKYSFPAMVLRLFGKKRESKTRYWQEVDENGVPVFRTFMTGGPRFVCLDASQFGIDPAAGKAGIDGARYAYDMQLWSYDELAEAYPELRSELHDFDWSHQVVASSVEEAIAGRSAKGSSAEYAQTGIVIDFYHRPSSAYGMASGANVRVLVKDYPSAGGSVNGILLHTEQNRTPDGDLPYRSLGSEVPDRNWWGHSLLHQSVFAQRVANEHLTLMATGAASQQQIVIGAKSLKGEEPGIVAHEVQNMDNVVVLAFGPEVNLEDPKLLSGINSVAPNERVLSTVLMLNQAATRSGAPLPSNAQFAGEANRNVRASQTVMGSCVRRFWKGQAELTMLAVRTIQVRMADSDLARALLEHEVTGWSLDIFRSADLGLMEINPMNGLMTDDDEATLLEWFKFAAQNKQDGFALFDPATVYDVIARRRRLGQTPYSIEEMRAKGENLLLREPPSELEKLTAGERPTVDTRQNHAIHLREHGIYYNANRRFMSDYEIKQFRSHMKDHEEEQDRLLVEQAKRAARMKMAAEQAVAEIMGPQGGGPAAPGQAPMQPSVSAGAQ